MKKIIIQLLLKEVTRLQMELESANKLREQDRDIRIGVCQENDKLKESISIWSNDETNLRVKLSEQAKTIKQLKEKIDTLEALRIGMPQWKSSLVNGMPILKVGDNLVYKYEGETHPYHRFMSDSADSIFLPVVGSNFDYFIIPANNATNS